jgi:signal transduction histidine kinase/CheY-like chemotaxis protein
VFPNGAEAARLKGLAAGADDCVSDSTPERELAARVAGLAQLSEARREPGHGALDDVLAATLRLRVELARDLEAMERLHEFATRLLQAPQLGNMLEEILAATIELQGADFGNIRLFDEASGTLRIAVQQGFQPEFVERFRECRRGDGSACGIALEGGARVWIEDVNADPRYASHLAAARGAGYRAVQATPLYGRGGGLVGMLSTHFRRVRPFTEHELRLTDLYATLAAGFVQRTRNEEALRLADQRKDEFLAMLAHELRNPLAPLASGLDVLGRGVARDERLSRTVHMMDRQMSHLVRLVDDLLDVGRITSGKLELRATLLPLDSVVESAIDATRDSINAHRHELFVERRTSGMRVMGDFDRLVQVFANLISNAVKYTPRDGRIRIVTREADGHAVVEVIDTGIGIPAPDIPNLFELFTQVPSHRSHAEGGLGIGLSLVRSLVHLHGGTVTADSAGDGMGSRFMVRLPLHVSEPAAAQAPDGDESRPESSALRVLIVDDNVDAAVALGMSLEIEGYAVSLAHDGVEALEKVDHSPPDVVLMDIGMPHMDGLEAARRLRRRPGGDRLYLVALTGWGQSRDRDMTREAGFDEHVVKPVRVSALRDIFSRAGQAA